MGSPLRLTKSPGLIIAGLTLLSLGIIGFGTWKMLRSGSAKPDPSATAVVETFRREVSALGRVEPEGGVYNIAPPSSRNSGNSRVLRVLVKKGDRVKQGQPLAVMDSYDGLRAEVMQAEAAVRETQAQLAQVKAGEKNSDIQSQVADVDALRSAAQVEEAAMNSARAIAARVEAEAAQADRDARRYRQLFSQGAVPAAELDTRELALVTKMRELEQARRDVEKAQRQLEAAVKRIEQSAQKVRSVSQVRPEDIVRAQTQVQTALVQLERSRVELNTAAVIAPSDGQILEIHTEDGESVGSKGILDMGQTQTMNVIAEVYETDIQLIRLGQPVAITSPVLGQPLSGRVKAIGLKINKKDVLDSDPVADTDARVVEVEIQLDDSAPLAALTNLQVNVSIQTEPPLNSNPSGPTFSGPNFSGTNSPGPSVPSPSFAEPSPTEPAPANTNGAN